MCHPPHCPTFSLCVTQLQLNNHLSLIACPFPFQTKQTKKKTASTGGNYDSRFDVGKASGTLIVARPLDAEQRSNYNLTVEATDGTRSVSTQVIETLTKWSASWWGGCHAAAALAAGRRVVVLCFVFFSVGLTWRSSHWLDLTVKLMKSSSTKPLRPVTNNNNNVFLMSSPHDDAAVGPYKTHYY